MIRISGNVSIPDSNVVLKPVHASGPGGQHVNKVATGIHLRFDILASDLPERYKERLLALTDSRITSQGIIVIKAQSFKSQEKNRVDALARLVRLIQSVGKTKKRRKPTRPTRASKKKRLDSKTRRGKIKALRKPPMDS